MEDEFGPYEVSVEQDVRVPMRDGIHLATDLYYPVNDGKPLDTPLPTVLVRTAYDRGGFEPRARYFASHGYLSISQDVRGTFGSEGDFFAFVNEVDDGMDVLDWIVNHPQSNGRVGMYGCSYMSWVQLALATQNPKGLACLIPFGIAIDTFHHYAYPYGGLQLGMIRWVIFDVWRRSEEARSDPEMMKAIESIDFIRFAAQMPWKRGETVLARSPQFEDIVFHYLDNKTYNDFWKQPGHAFESYFENFPDIPMLWISGWYDGYPRSVCEGYEKLGAMGRQANQYLLLGPWVHNQLSGNDCGDVNFGPHAHIPRMDTQRAFFDRHLKQDASVPDPPRARAFVMGGGTGQKLEHGKMHHGGYWWHGEDWPPPAMKTAPWYLHSDGRLSPIQPNASEASTTYEHDPADPVPSISVPWIFNGYQERGAADQLEPTELVGNCTPGRPLADRGDVCVFQSQPLAEPVTLLGPFSARLWVSSDATDTDFTVKLVDVYPPNEDYPHGYAMLVCEGLLRMRYRESNVEMVLMQPGEVYPVTVSCFPASNRFEVGHRIRIDIASSNYPRYEINTNIGDPDSAEHRIARNTIHHDHLRCSHALLPIMPNA